MKEWKDGYTIKVGTKIKCIKSPSGELKKGYFILQPKDTALLVSNPAYKTHKERRIEPRHGFKVEGKEDRGLFAYWEVDTNCYEIIERVEDRIVKRFNERFQR